MKLADAKALLVGHTIADIELYLVPGADGIEVGTLTLDDGSKVVLGHYPEGIYIDYALDPAGEMVDVQSDEEELLALEDEEI
jgi:hypothetical protein